MQADRNFLECELTDVEGRVNDQVSSLVHEGVDLAEAVERIERENNFADVADALADPVFRAWLLGEPHPAAERDRLAALLQQVEKFADEMAGYCSPLGVSVTYAERLRKVLRGESAI